MGIWLTELRRNLPADIVLHVVGTKADIVARDPSKREVPFERCIAYVAENLAPGVGGTPPPTATPLGMPGFLHDVPARTGPNTPGGGGGLLGLGIGGGGGGGQQPAAQVAASGVEPRSPSSKRSSGFWGQEVGWDACHEISAESGEGVEEVFRVVTRKLVEQNRRMQQALLAATATPGGTPGVDGHGYGYSHGAAGFEGAGGGGGSGAAGYGGVGGGPAGYFEGANNPRGSFRVGRDRRSWLFSPGFSPAVPVDQGGGGAAGGEQGREDARARMRRRCC
jgi:hypothetical protein